MNDEYTRKRPITSHVNKNRKIKQVILEKENRRPPRPMTKDKFIN